MAKEKTSTTYTVEQLNGFLNDLHLGQPCPLTQAEIFELMDKADESNFSSTRELFKFEGKQGVTIPFVVKGVETTIFDNDKYGSKEFEVVIVEDKAGEEMMLSDAMLVSHCKKLSTLPCYVRITYIDDVVGDKGKYKKFKVISPTPAK